MKSSGITSVPPTMSADFVVEKRCTSCKTAFSCGIKQKQCWCNNLPNLKMLQINKDADCMCPSCLERLVRTARPSTEWEAAK